MYPRSLLWWVAGTAVLMGILAGIGLVILWIDRKVARWQEREGKRRGWRHDDEED